MEWIKKDVIPENTDMNKDEKTSGVEIKLITLITNMYHYHYSVFAFLAILALFLFLGFIRIFF